MLTATEQLWRVASINDVSANVKGGGERANSYNNKNGRQNIGSNVEAHWAETDKCHGNIDSVQ